MENAGKGAAINVEVYGGFEKGYVENKEDSWERTTRLGFPRSLSGRNLP